MTSCSAPSRNQFLKKTFVFFFVGFVIPASAMIFDAHSNYELRVPSLLVLVWLGTAFLSAIRASLAMNDYGRSLRREQIG